MNILALETSSNACSAALLIGNAQENTCIERFEIAPRQHTQLILPMLESLLLEADLTLAQMDALAYGRGPGAFTGVRVATSVTQAISFGADLSVAQISSLAAIAQGVAREHRLTAEAQKILVANDARMNEVYFAIYENHSGFMDLVGLEHLIRPEQLLTHLDHQASNVYSSRSWFGAGTGWDVYAETLQKVSHLSTELVIAAYPHARDVAYLAIKEVENNALVSAEAVSPVYLRNNVAKKSTANT